MKTKLVHKSEIRVGDTIVHNDELRTVGTETFSKDEFTGLTLWGDSYRLGYKLVELVTEL